MWYPPASASLKQTMILAIRAFSRSSVVTSYDTRAFAPDLLLSIRSSDVQCERLLFVKRASDPKTSPPCKVFSSLYPFVIRIVGIAKTIIMAGFATSG